MKKKGGLKIMTVSELKYEVSKNHPYYFSRKSMKFFGDSMGNYGVRSAVIVSHSSEEKIEVWELYRKRPVRGGNMGSAYFRKTTFEQVFMRRIYD
jgi:hypothetical protein